MFTWLLLGKKSKKVRGTLCSLVSLFVSIGLLYIMTIGALLEVTVAIFMISIYCHRLVSMNIIVDLNQLVVSFFVVILFRHHHMVIYDDTRSSYGHI